MGNSDSKKIDVDKSFNPLQWKQIGTHRQIVKIVQSVKGLGQGEVQIIPFDQKRSLQKQTQIYQYRKDQDNALVKCLGFQVLKAKSHALCGNNQMLKVLTQRIPLRLNQLPQLSLPQSLYALSESLRGYKDCYNKLGSFEVTDQMIGINNSGQIKSWVNQDFAQNHPTFQKPILQTSGTQGLHQNNGSQGRNQLLDQSSISSDQSQMVKNIIKVIQRKNQGGKFPPNLTQRFNKSNITFDQAFKQIEGYSRQRNLFIPDRILNLKAKYGQNSKGKSANNTTHFTPGDQYNRDIKDPLYRQPRQFSFQNNHHNRPSNIVQPLQGGRISSPIIYNQPNYSGNTGVNGAIGQSQPSSINRVSSPIKILYQNNNAPSNIQSHTPSQYTKPQFPVFQSSPNMYPVQHPMSSKITFNMMTPQHSTLVFDNQSVKYPHMI